MKTATQSSNQSTLEATEIASKTISESIQWLLSVSEQWVRESLSSEEL